MAILFKINIVNDYKFFPDKLNITLTCASGVEKALKSELKRLGYEDAPALNGTLTLNATAYDVARLNISLRTADRVYVKVAEFPADNFDVLYEGVKAVRWEDFLPKDAQIWVNGKCVKSKLFAVSACQGIVKKAISDRLCSVYKTNRLIENGALYQVEFWLFKDVVSVLINTSGAGLHKRGYRDMVGIAPIKETLASALVLSSDYYYKNPFLDPFCGSGTIPIETAMIALNVASGKLRDFAYQNFEYFPKNAYKLCLEEALDLEKPTASPVIFASDIDKKAVELAKQHARRAGVEKAINFSVKNVKDFYTELKNGTIVTNPPYGERVYDKDEAEACYKHLRKVYDKLDSWSLFLITSYKGFERVFGIKSDRNRKLFNSNKECRYYYYYAKKDRE